MIDWGRRNGGFLSPESIYENQLSNLSYQIDEKDKEIDQLKSIIKEVNNKLKRDYILHYVENNDKVIYECIEILDKADKGE